MSQKSHREQAVRPLFQPFFTQHSEKAEILFEWVKKDSKISNVAGPFAGQVYFEMKGLIVPAGWSQTALDIAASKYFRRSLKKENSIQKLVDRICSGLERAVQQSKLFSRKSEMNQFVEEVKFHLYNQSGAFNSPVWFNCGLSETYQLKAPGHHFAWNAKTKKVIPILDVYQNPQCSACFIQSVEDNLESIFELVKSEAKLFKYGSGSGTNFSNLRSKYEKLSSGGTSSGLISFLEVLDKSAGAIKSGGTTRRAAKMVCVDLDHPEIEDFIDWKKKEERKAKALISLGYSSDLDGEAYHTVSGQNANNSVRVPDRFMKAVAENKFWELRARDGKKILKKIKAQDLWKKICEAAHECADPGLQFDNTINDFHTVPNTAPIRASNPCSEYMFLDNSACNLASLNLTKFYSENSNGDLEFKIYEFIQTVRTFIIAQESLVDYSSYPTFEIAQNAHDYRPLGLGYANLGSLLMQMGLPYDSDAGRAWAGVITALMTGMAYLTSAEMAQKLGAFPGFKKNKLPMLKVLKKHQSALKMIQWNLVPEIFQEICKEVWAETIYLGEKFGFRNAQVTVIAPTGTIGLVMDCDTTGIEPEYSLVKTKKLSGGGQIQMTNHSVERALRQHHYSDSTIQKIIEEIKKTGSMKSSMTFLKVEDQKIFETAAGDHVISPEGHLKMMAAVQPFISGAISKTVNMPANSTVEDVSKIYQMAWKLELKAVAIYRDGSKFTQPLTSGQPMTNTQFPNCTVCGAVTTLESGCYRCLNCGTTTACAG